MSREDTASAIRNYELGVEKSTRNGLDKAICQIKLGDLYFQKRDYVKAQPNFSGALSGIRKEYIRKALSDFKGVEHRLEKVATIRGVNFINDSKATNVNSCWYALQSMAGKTVLILGGKDKGNDYTEIEDLVREKCSALVYLGLHNEKLHDFFDRLGLPVADVQTGMKDAVEAAFKLAKKGETVLLSPCCASFDLFKSYEDRGDQFKACVRAL